MDKAEVDLRATAYHEAGHAVAILVNWYGLPELAMFSASIVPDGGTLGHIAGTVGVAEWAADDPTDKEMIAYMVVGDLAGYVAERRFAGTANIEQSRQDRANASRHIWRIVDTQEQGLAYLREKEAEAEQLISDYWEAVEAVATALLEKKTLVATEVADIIDDVTDRFTTYDWTQVNGKELPVAEYYKGKLIQRFDLDQAEGTEDD